MATLAATAVTPGNVSIPAALITGNSTLSPFKYEDRDGHVVVFAVPIIDEHEDDMSPKPFDRLTGKTFEAVFESTKGYEKNGAYAAITIGHTSGSEDDNFREVVGHIRNFKTVGKEPHRQIAGDFYFRKDFFDAAILTNMYPRRSAEISSVDMRIDPVAILGATSPARPLPDMLFRKSPDRQVLFAKYPNADPAIKEPTMEADVKAMFDEIGVRLAKFEKGLGDALAKFAKPDGEDPEDGKKKEEKDEGKPDETDGGGDKTKTKKAADADAKVRSDASVAAKFAVLEQGMETLRKQNDELVAKAARDDVVQTMKYMRASGIILGDEDAQKTLTDVLVALSPEDRTARYADIKKHYARAPVADRLDRSGLQTEWEDTDNGPEDQESYEVAQTAKAVKFQKDNPGVSLMQALHAVNGTASR